MADPLCVEAQSTPNPNAYKFTVNRRVTASGALTLASAAEAFGSPLAAHLFAVPGVSRLFLTAEFITVSREPSADWDRLVPDLVAAIEQYFYDFDALSGAAP